MNNFVFTKRSNKDFKNLSKVEQDRIVEKFNYLKNHPDIMSIVLQVEAMYPITHRLRVGSLRLLLHLSKINKNNPEFIITKIGHRKEIYK